MSTKGTGTLYLVSTPIGNLGDITTRAVFTLSEVDFIAAEDTRVTLKLLGHLGIKKQLVSYFEHNRRESGDKILARLLRGESCALVTDAGTPAISDPGDDLVRLCAQTDVPIVTIPGPCAAVAALSLSGLAGGRFTFEGFLSTSKKSRFEHLHELKTQKRTMVFYEAPHKLLRTLNDMLLVFGDRNIAISRELTKLYEQTLRFNLKQAIEYFTNQNPRGEFVIVLEGDNTGPEAEMTIEDAASIAKDYVSEGLSIKDAAKKACEQTGLPKNAIYKLLIMQ